MADSDGRTKARLAVHAEMADRGWNPGRLAAESGADPGTIGDFLNGARWPKLPTQGKIERALGWPAGTLSAIVAGMDPPPVGGVAEDPEDGEDTLLYRRPDGLSDEEWERVKNESRGFIEWQIQRAAQER